MRQTNGATYEFLEKLLPPPRYVNADFHFYPIVLSAPDAKVKARLISNGSGINLRGGARGWNDFGTPVTFRVGPDELRFGEVLSRLQHPKLAQGFLPIVQIDYEHPTPKHDSAKTAAQNSIEAPEVYRLEAFASTDPALAENGVMYVAFSLVGGTTGFITADLDPKSSITFTNGKAMNAKGEVVAYFDKNWRWERGSVHANLNISKDNIPKRVVFAIPTQPLDASLDFSLEKFSYDSQLKVCRQSWLQTLAKGMSIETPEPLVNNALKHLVIQDFMICKGSNLNYSHGNQYEKKYAAETSDAAVPLMSFGYEDDMRRFLPVILKLNDPRLTNHFASHKLDTVCRFYWQTRDLEFVKNLRPQWQKELDWILNHRGEKGLLPKDNYCTDIEQPVYSFSSNAKCWAALRDMVPVLEAVGDREMAAQVADAASKYKKDILAAASTSIRSETEPPFVPCALFGAEDIHDPITETRIGSYWDLVANYIIGSGIFTGTEKENWLPRYFETHGGLCMGLTRSAAANHTFWMGKHRTNPLYGMRYVNDCLRRDDVERALVNFYGMLAHGMTRNTFIGAEGTALQPLDDGGRQFYCPPNTASNGEWLWTLRHLLVQDFDLNNDGTPETLRLAYGTPKRWLDDGKTIVVNRAPTAFGIVSFKLESHLSKGEVAAEVELPARNRPQKVLFRARLPDGWKVHEARIADKPVAVDQTGAVDLSAFSGKQMIRFLVAKE
ncbi:MAG: hypothetical protein JWM68_4461 [Verrucomicrobiales bacterium]|nr:hypothetical protein [Verrucomicrobiales bacterium]